MAQLLRNNLLIFLGALAEIGATPADEEAAAGILTRFDYVVVGAPAWATPASVEQYERILEMVKAIKPGIRLFGATTFTTEVAWQAERDAWTASTVIEPLLSGLFIEDFEVATRTEQNAAVTSLHTADLGAMVSAGVGTSSEYPILGRQGLQVASVLGQDTENRDFIVLPGLYKNDENVANPTTEAPAATVARSDYAMSATRTVVGSVITNHNLGVLGLLGAGTGATVNESIYRQALAQLSAKGFDGMGIVHYDRGVSSNSYFEDHRANVFRV